MKTLLLATALFVSIGCTSQFAKDGASNHLREVASFETECRIVKHPTKDLYNLTMYGKKYNQFWYSEVEMELLYQRFVSQGRCD